MGGGHGHGLVGARRDGMRVPVDLRDDDAVRVGFF